MTKTIQWIPVVASVAVIATIAVLFGTMTVNGLDSSLMFDIQAMRKANAAKYFAPKVKKAQEEVLFGNQQNKITDNHSFGRPAKRALPVETFQNEVDKEDGDDSGPYEPMQLPLVYQPKYRNAQYYYDPSLYEAPYFEETRSKRNARSQREKRLVKREARTKRELQIDPQELLALLALWEAEQSRKQQTAATAEMKQYPYEEYVPMNDEENDLDINEDANDSGIWLDGQTVPVHRIKPRYFPPYRWSPSTNQQAKRYLKEIMMKRNTNNGNINKEE